MNFQKLVLVSVTMFFLCPCSEAQLRRSNITLGSSLSPTRNSSWLSNSGIYAFGFYPQGGGFSVGVFISGIQERTVVWTFNRDSPPLAANSTLHFSSEGRLVLESTRGLEYIGDQVQPASWASMLDSGSFAFFGSDGSLIWQSFDHPTDTLLPTQRLPAVNELVSSASESRTSSGIFRLKMQRDGNLVQYPVNTPDTGTYAYYATGTAGDNMSLVFDAAARLYLVNSTGVIIRNISDFVAPPRRESGMVYLMRIDADGIFRLYSHRTEGDGQWSIEWSSSADMCSPKGLCGLNGYCIQNDLNADCRCLPGFDFAQKGNWTAGCVRNFVADSCGSKRTEFQMDEVPTTEWENVQYSIITVDDKDGCIQACLQDCNCEAALYRDKQCQKQRLPLRYGRRAVGSSSVALVKVYNSTAPYGTGADSRGADSRSGRLVNRKILIASVVVASLGLAMMVVSAVAILCKNKIRAYKRVDDGTGRAEFLGEESSVGPRPFRFDELEKITSGFAEEIGKGSSGTVYRGKMGDKEVAVKRLETALDKDGEGEFRNEMKSIGRTHHRNLVRLLGYCHDTPNRLLVYPYMQNGSLAETIYRPENRPGFKERLEISCDVARGILYLHEEGETQIIHCDIKPQNVLMDEQRRAKISDFGLAKMLKPDQTRTFTGIRGTRGYVAPEWHRRQPITTKADVYSFGVVLLEIACCRRSVSWELPEEEAVLEEWAFECFERGELMRLVESGGDEMMMMSTAEKRQFERMVMVALWCVQDEPSIRPSMKKVVLMLEGTVDIPIPPSPQFFA